MSGALTLWPVYAEDSRRLFTHPIGSWATFCWACKGGTLAKLWPGSPGGAALRSYWRAE